MPYTEILQGWVAVVGPDLIVQSNEDFTQHAQHCQRTKTPIYLFF